MNIKLVLAYDGTNYHGFQKQSGTKLPTIQGILEEALRKLTREEIKVNGAGRTDAGVHARGQVVNFRTSARIPPARYVPALNGMLPPDIRVMAAEEVDESFHARYSARAKTYTYTIYNASLPDVFRRLYTWHVSVPLNVEAMRKGAAFLLGRHDFSAFQATGSSARNPVRHLMELTLTCQGPEICLTFTADGFLYNMVRNITGTLVEVGMGRRAPEEIAAILASRERRRAGICAPPQGLCLEKVYY
ncbi:MAG: tRNA pseudouridine38-40 synthase [Eubacteriales bacterium]|nr:tRNA pseudouridine38-40 synthase [Eubacteriales bacterium]